MPYGNINADVLQSSTTGTPPVFKDGSSNQIGTLCRAWVNFDGSTSPGTIRAAFNVSSVTRSATGQFTVNFVTAFTDANYSFSMHCIDTAGTDRTIIAGGSTTGTAPTTTALNFNTFSSTTSTMANPVWIAASVFR